MMNKGIVILFFFKVRLWDELNFLDSINTPATPS